MLLSYWLTKLSVPHKRTHRSRRRHRRLPFVVELLEDRTVPTVNALSGFDGLDFAHTQDGAPPDTIAAAGPDYIVEAVNTDLAIYNKTTGQEVFKQDLGTLFSSVRTGNFLSDPVVVYDEAAQRFAVGVLDLKVNQVFGSVSSDSFLFAVSNNSDPTTAADFTEMHSIDMTGNTGVFADYPRIGWNADGYFVSFNMFTTGIFGGSYDHASIIAIGKSSVTDQNNATFTYTQTNLGFPNFTLAPATMHGSSSGDPMYFVEEHLNSRGNTTGKIDVVAMRDALTTPSFTTTTLTVDPYTQPPAAEQKGSSGLMETNDTRILNAEWRNNTLVAAQTVGVSSDSDAHARWYQIDTSSTKPTLAQQGTIGVNSGSNSYFPSIAIAPNGDIGMTYIQSSSSEYMSMYVTGRTSSDPTGTMQTPVLAKAGETSYSATFDSSPYRAGDYSGITVDPINSTFWAANEYAKTPTDSRANWGTWIKNFSLQSLPTDSNPPAKPMGLAVTSPDGTSGTLLLTWTANSESDLAGYKVYRSTTSGGSYNFVTTVGTSSSPSYTDTGLTNGTPYYYVVTAFDTSGNESAYSSEAIGTPTDTQPPAAPQNLTATAGDGQVTLNWTANTESDLDHYNVYRGTTNGGPYTLIVSQGGTSFTDTGLTNGTTYYYVVTAVDTTGNESTDSNQASATPGTATGNANDIYVGNMDWSDSAKGHWINVTVVVTIQQDSNADGAAESTDANVGGATLTLVMDHYYGGLLVGSTTFQNVNTNGNGQAKFTLKTQLGGNFIATVTSLSANSPLTWNKTIVGEDNPSEYDGVPGGHKAYTVTPVSTDTGDVYTKTGAHTIVASQNHGIDTISGIGGNTAATLPSRFVYEGPLMLSQPGATGDISFTLGGESTTTNGHGNGRINVPASHHAAEDAFFALLGEEDDAGL